ncbi:hypothetical protein AgCh_015977 [Apium graveolens]
MKHNFKILNDWKVARQKVEKEKVDRGGTNAGKSWKPPKPGCLKLNIDTSFHQGADSFSIGLEFMVANLCPCADGIVACPRIEPIVWFEINAYCSVGRLYDAVKMFDCMSRLIDGKASVALYNVVIHGFVKFMEFEKGLRFHERMLRIGERKVDEGVGMTYEMVELGCEFSVVTCEISVDGLRFE